MADRRQNHKSAPAARGKLSDRQLSTLFGPSVAAPLPSSASSSKAKPAASKSKPLPSVKAPGKASRKTPISAPIKASVKVAAKPAAPVKSALKSASKAVAPKAIAPKVAAPKAAPKATPKAAPKAKTAARAKLPKPLKEPISAITPAAAPVKLSEIVTSAKAQLAAEPVKVPKNTHEAPVLHPPVKPVVLGPVHKPHPPVKVPDPIQWGKSLADLGEQSRKLLTAFADKQDRHAHSPMMAAAMVSSFSDLMTHMMSNPLKVMKTQVELWQNYAQLWQQSAQRFFSGSDTKPVAAPHQGDKRFKDEAWQTNPVFDYIKQSYLLTARWLQSQVTDVDGLTDKDKKKLDFYTRQFIDALSPSNFAITNPQVIRTTLETGGQNLLNGLQNLLDDMDAGRISMTDETAFQVGENLAVTKGDVVFRNELIELIQYAPTTETVAKRPLLIVPPWINKFYILDLKPENSFIKWAVGQGLTVFCISWANPDTKLAELDFKDYMERGILAAQDAMAKLTGEDTCNVIGYCLGGTLLASTLAYLHATEPARAARFKSATYFTTLVDFSDVGELGVFIDEQQLEALEKAMKHHGYLDGRTMATTFNMLRANDLIWSFVVNNYLLGREPFPFDLLYWNTDSTRMPAKMHSFYLREMYQRNMLVKHGSLKFNGVPIDLRKIKTPTYILSAREDHIAPWTSTYAATRHYQGPVTFVLAGSGHIAGVINPPAAGKYGFWVNKDLPETPDQWLMNAQEQPGSWWTHWRTWLTAQEGGVLPASARRAVKSLGPAPGSYVKVRTV